MAKAKSKDEIKADIVDQEVEDVTTPTEDEVKTLAAKKVRDVIKETEDVSVDVPETKSTAKAGKRSAKAVKEAEAKEAKQERKAHAKEDKSDTKPKQSQKPPRSKLERRGKKYREVAKHIEPGRDYTLEDALTLAIKTSPVKFDAIVELHLNLNVDPKQADQNVRGTVVLPAGTGKSVRVAVFAEAAEAKEAKEAGADIAGSDDFLAQLDKEKLDFDVLIAQPSQMPKLGKYARLLGPKGLMPNPKSGTVTNDVAKAVKEAKAGRLEYRVDSTGIIHAGIGKVSFGGDKLTENCRALLNVLKTNKPASVKGALISRAYVTTSMGPSIPLSLSDV